MEITNVILLSMLFAVTMKIAREIGDGRLKLFKGSGIFFGVLWGYFAANLILYDNMLANIWMAAVAGWILRSKIAHFNIALGTTIVFLAFLLRNENFLFERNVFLLFFAVMAISGLMHDFLYQKGILSRKKSELMHSVIFYTFLPLYYSTYSGNWLIFASFFSFMLVYELTRKAIYTVEKREAEVPISRQVLRKRVTGENIRKV